MPALKPTEFYATITWLGRVSDSSTDIRAVPIQSSFASYEGIAGDCHSGLTRPACVRTSDQHKPGTDIRNVRQLSIVSAEDLALIAQDVGIAAMNPAQLGATLVIEGIPDFTHVPPSSRLQGADGVTLVIDMENRPCTLVSREVEKDHAGHGKGFKPAAKNRRGVTAWIEREGNLTVGDKLRLHVPDQPVWGH